MKKLNIEEKEEEKIRQSSSVIFFVFESFAHCINKKRQIFDTELNYFNIPSRLNFKHASTT